MYRNSVYSKSYSVLFSAPSCLLVLPEQKEVFILNAIKRKKKVDIKLAWKLDKFASLALLTSCNYNFTLFVYVQNQCMLDHINLHVEV